MMNILKHHNELLSSEPMYAYAYAKLVLALRENDKVNVDEAAEALGRIIAEHEAAIDKPVVFGQILSDLLPCFTYTDHYENDADKILTRLMTVIFGSLYMDEDMLRAIIQYRTTDAFSKRLVPFELLADRLSNITNDILRICLLQELVVVSGLILSKNPVFARVTKRLLEAYYDCPADKREEAAALGVTFMR